MRSKIMPVAAQIHKMPSCCHLENPNFPAGVAVVSIGNSLRSDDGVAQAICDLLPMHILQKICRFDLGPYTSLLTDCLIGHAAAIVVDSTLSGNLPGTMTVLDLSELIQLNSPLKVPGSHGFSLLDELRIGRWRGLLPEKMLFVGVEAGNTDWGEQLSQAVIAKLPTLSNQLANLIEFLGGCELKHA